MPKSFNKNKTLFLPNKYPMITKITSNPKNKNKKITWSVYYSIDYKHRMHIKATEFFQNRHQCFQVSRSLL